MHTEKNTDTLSGFTLVELLVVLVLLSLLSASLFAALRLGSADLNSIADLAIDVSGQNAADAVLEQTLRRAYPEYVPSALVGGTGTVAFDGTGDKIRFLAPAPLTLALGGMAWMDLSFQRDSGNERLVIEARSELALPSENQGIREVLAANIVEGRFSYWGKDPTGKAPYWHETWQNRSELPSLVRIRVSFSHADRREWPDIIIALVIRTDQGCEFVALTQSCLRE